MRANAFGAGDHLIEPPDHEQVAENSGQLWPNSGRRQGSWSTVDILISSAPPSTTSAAYHPRSYGCNENLVLSLTRGSNRMTNHLASPLSGYETSCDGPESSWHSCSFGLFPRNSCFPALYSAPFQKCKLTFWEIRSHSYHRYPRR